MLKVGILLRKYLQVANIHINFAVYKITTQQNYNKTFKPQNYDTQNQQQPS